MKVIEQQQVWSALSETFLFQGVTEREFQADLSFLDACYFRQYTSGSIIQSAKSPVDGIAVIVSGTAEVLSSTSDAAIRLRTMEKNALFGVATLYRKDPRYATVIRAVTNTELLILPEAAVKELLRVNSKIAENYISFLSERICFLNRKLSAFTAGSADAKLAAYLSDLPKDADGTLTLSTSLSALADALGMGRASLYRALDKFESDGLIRRNGKNIVILDDESLQAMFR